MLAVEDLPACFLRLFLQAVQVDVARSGTIVFHDIAQLLAANRGGAPRHHFRIAMLAHHIGRDALGVQFEQAADLTA